MRINFETYNHKGYEIDLSESHLFCDIDKPYYCIVKGYNKKFKVYSHILWTKKLSTLKRRVISFYKKFIDISDISFEKFKELSHEYYINDYSSVLYLFNGLYFSTEKQLSKQELYKEAYEYYKNWLKTTPKLEDNIKN